MFFNTSPQFIFIFFLLVSPLFLYCTDTLSPEIIPQVISFPLIKSPHRGIDIQKVMNYQMPHIITRYRKDYNVSEDTAKVHEVELKRYFILAVDKTDDEDPLGMMSTQVDNLWHTFLLFTKDYQAFCHDMFGKFIHHIPLTDKES